MDSGVFAVESPLPRRRLNLKRIGMSPAPHERPNINLRRNEFSVLRTDENETAERSASAMGQAVSVHRASNMEASGVEDGSYGSFIAVNVDEPKGVVEGEHTRGQSENDRGVSAHDGVEIAAIVRADLDTRARRPHLDQLAVDRDPHRR